MLHELCSYHLCAFLYSRLVCLCSVATSLEHQGAGTTYGKYQKNTILEDPFISLIRQLEGTNCEASVLKKLGRTICRVAGHQFKFWALLKFFKSYYYGEIRGNFIYAHSLSISFA
jgi:hypothetical protein